MPDFAAYRPEARGVHDPTLVVRPARAGDAGRVAAVAANRGAARPDLLHKLPVWVQDPGVRVLVAEVGGAVVGWAMAGPWVRPGAEAGTHVCALTVDPDARRRGAGSGLLAGLAAWTWSGSDVLWSIVNARNEASIDLHRRHGFDVVRRIGEYATVTFDGGSGVLLRARRPAGHPSGEPARPVATGTARGAAARPDDER